MTRAREFGRIGVDAVFVEALPDRDAMTRCVEVMKDIGVLSWANST